MIPAPRLAALAAALAALALFPAEARAQAAPPAEWRGARWGMTVDEVLKAFPGEAKRLDSPLKLADGNVVAAGIDSYVLAATSFRVRFVFDAAGGLVLVSLRTPETEYAKDEVLKPIEKAIADRIGPPTSRSGDKEFIDMRQVTWMGPTGRVDLKYVPGVVVVLHAAPSQKPPEAPPAPR
jgi:hypothetical protein